MKRETVMNTPYKCSPTSNKANSKKKNIKLKAKRRKLKIWQKLMRSQTDNKK